VCGKNSHHIENDFSDNTDGLYKLANLHYQLGEADPSLNEVRECLRLDPEHKHCYPLYKKLKKVAKFLTEAQVCIFDVFLSQMWV